MDLRFVEIPKIENDILLEDLAKDLTKSEGLHTNINIHGRPGQKQDGIDVYAREISTDKWTGIQCKVRSTNRPFTKDELMKEINQAIEFNPKIDSYYLYTTLSRDIETQKIEREIADELKAQNHFDFQIFFWEDITDKLRQEVNESVYYRYYHRYFRDNLVLGHAIGKLVNLTLCFDDESDTHCEFIIGKIPHYKDDIGKKVDYFRGTYYIVNLLTMKIEFFGKSQKSNKAHVFPSDIENAINNRIDTYRICSWLQSIEDIDSFIYDDVHNYTFSITNEERDKYLRSYEADGEEE